MSPEHCQRLQALFDAALQLESNQREAYLDAACAGDPAMRAEVADLLAQDALARRDAFLGPVESADRDAQTRAQSPPPPSITDGDPGKTKESWHPPTLSHPSEMLRAVHPRNLAPGTLLGDRYLLEKVLGRGGMGQVYLARDQVLDRPVAVKVIRPSDPELRNRTLCEAGLREAFAEEARIGANLIHPAIATVFDFGFHDQEPFIVFEYMQGETLRALLSRRGGLPLEEVRLILGPLAQALDFAHSHHVVHRDLKPDNIRATLQGHFKILDFGLAKEFHQAVDWRFAGTPLYASPEQAQHLPCDGRTDQYALALMAFEMITGHRVFEHADAYALLEMHRSQEPVSPKQFLPDVPETVCAALARALQKEPNQRFATCEEFAVAIGCQLLSAPVSRAEVLRLTAVRRMFGEWRSARFRLIRRGTAVYLALTANALWVSHRGEIRRWPLQAITDIQRNWSGNKIHLRIQDGQKTGRQSFHFVKRAEGRQWYLQLQILKQQLPGDASDPSDFGQVEPVILMRRRPEMRYQSLGTVEFKDAKRQRAEVGLQIRAAMIGADAVVDVQQERLPEFRRTVCRKSGMAIRAVDSAGRLELRSRWFATQVSQLSLWMLMLIGISFIGTLLGGFFISSAGAAGIGVPLANGVTFTQRLVSVGLLVILIHSWPLAIVLPMRWLQWPQLLRPAALAPLALGARPLAGLLGELSAVAVTGKWQAIVPHLLMLLDPINLGILVFSWFLCRRAWRAYSEYRSLVQDAAKQVPPLRQAAKGLTWATSIGFAALLWGWVGWSQYLYVSHFAFPGDNNWKERQAVDAFNRGRAKMTQQPLEAEQAFRDALSRWQELIHATPSRPEHRHNLAATYLNLGSILQQRGQVAEAEEDYRQALLHYDKLGADFPGYEKHKKDRDLAQQKLKLLTMLKPILELYAEEKEAQQLAAFGEYQLVAKIYRKALERHEQQRKVFRDEETYVRLLAAKENRLAWFLVSCPDVQERNPIEAIELARKAVEHAPQQGAYWNTLGAAYYRAGDWKESMAALEKSMELRQGGDAFDWFFLAMAHHQLNHIEEAQKWLDKGVQWIEQAEKGELKNSWNQEQWKVQRKEAELLRREAEGLIRPTPEHGSDADG